MKQFLFVFLLALLIFSASAQVNIGEDPEEVAGVVLEQQVLKVITFDNNTQTVNASELWITAEGIMDNVPDLFQTFIDAGFNNTNKHDQELNTTSNVTFDTVNVTGGGLNFGDDVNATFGTDSDFHMGFVSAIARVLLSGVDLRLTSGQEIEFGTVGDIRDASGMFTLRGSQVAFIATSISPLITFSSGSAEFFRATTLGINTGFIVNEDGSAGINFRAETDNNPNGIFLSASSDAVSFFTSLSPRTFNVNGSSNFTGDMDINGNVTNGVCGQNFQFAMNEVAAHTSGLAWQSGATRNQRGWRVACDGIINTLAVGWDVDPDISSEFVHIEINNADVLCDLNISAGVGNNLGAFNNTCNVRFDAGDAIKIEGDFDAGVGMNDVTGIVGGRYIYSMLMMMLKGGLIK